MHTIDIRGLSCNHCIAAVTEALNAVPGVIKAVVTKTTAVCEGTAELSALHAAIEEAGYEVVANL